MLGNPRIEANAPVLDVDLAIEFYEGRLGLELYARGEQAPYADRRRLTSSLARPARIGFGPGRALAARRHLHGNEGNAGSSCGLPSLSALSSHRPRAGRLDA
jgi:catechol 2,3-dioxygenase-like lactoylglutathione lyase family enzyme